VRYDIIHGLLLHRNSLTRMRALSHVCVCERTLPGFPSAPVARNFRPWREVAEAAEELDALAERGRPHHQTRAKYLRRGKRIRAGERTLRKDEEPFPFGLAFIARRLT